MYRITLYDFILDEIKGGRYYNSYLSDNEHTEEHLKENKETKNLYDNHKNESEDNKYDFYKFLDNFFKSDSIPDNALEHMLNVPYFLEKIMSFSFLLCLDNILYDITFMPIQVVRSLCILIYIFLKNASHRLLYIFSNVKNYKFYKYATSNFKNFKKYKVRVIKSCNNFTYSGRREIYEKDSNLKRKSFTHFYSQNRNIPKNFFTFSHINDFRYNINNSNSEYSIDEKDAFTNNSIDTSSLICNLKDDNDNNYIKKSNSSENSEKNLIKNISCTDIKKDSIMNMKSIDDKKKKKDKVKLKKKKIKTNNQKSMYGTTKKNRINNFLSIFKSLSFIKMYNYLKNIEKHIKFLFSYVYMNIIHFIDINKLYTLNIFKTEKKEEAITRSLEINYINRRKNKIKEELSDISNEEVFKNYLKRDITKDKKKGKKSIEKKIVTENENLELKNNHNIKKTCFNKINKNVNTNVETYNLCGNNRNNEKKIYKNLKNNSEKIVLMNDQKYINYVHSNNKRNFSGSIIYKNDNVANKKKKKMKKKNKKNNFHTIKNMINNIDNFNNKDIINDNNNNNNKFNDKVNTNDNNNNNDFNIVNNINYNNYYNSDVKIHTNNETYNEYYNKIIYNADMIINSYEKNLNNDFDMFYNNKLKPFYTSNKRNSQNYVYDKFNEGLQERRKIKNITKVKNMKKKLFEQHLNSLKLSFPEYSGLIRISLILICIYIFSFVDTSRVYHYIRAQPFMKLYVVLNMLEILERLLRSLGKDLIDNMIRTFIRIINLHSYIYIIRNNYHNNNENDRTNNNKNYVENENDINDYINKNKKIDVNNFDNKNEMNSFADENKSKKISCIDGLRKEMVKNENFFSNNKEIYFRYNFRNKSISKDTCYYKEEEHFYSNKKKEKNFLFFKNNKDNEKSSEFKVSIFFPFYSVLIKFCMQYILVLFYILIHSFIHLVRFLSLNIAINSSESTMFLILVMSNFTEIKSTVFKKFTKISLFTIVASDAVERFYLFIDAFLVLLKMSTAYRTQNSFISISSWLIIILLLEVGVDWCKHSYLLKYNNLKSESLNKYFLTLLADVLISRTPNNNIHYMQTSFKVPCKNIFCFSHIPTRRLGYMSMPVVTLIVCSLPRLNYLSNISLFSFALSIWICLFLFKIILSIMIVSYTISEKHHLKKLGKPYDDISAL
ncbi:cyclic amine resistance locus protein, putative [Plasmodium relictum]|uniref:Cyclic amine resistance locus protein, putative n=1 Tax=Plasmodium relictum TaxID=85471 RepID=A0A1J1H4A0_PLARL|nr:cyclic amine resistance locus protein, putative [Plasmodium relictum]CRG99735.1 cyclic amine resistance locus protein, putative [Plasmodium relictum]